MTDWSIKFNQCQNDFENAHRLTLGMLCECQMTRRFVTRTRPRSPALPFVSSMESNLSIRISPGRIFICLKEKKLILQFVINVMWICTPAFILNKSHWALTKPITSFEVITSTITTIFFNHLSDYHFRKTSPNELS